MHPAAYSKYLYHDFMQIYQNRMLSAKLTQTAHQVSQVGDLKRKIIHFTVNTPKPDLYHLIQPEQDGHPHNLILKRKRGHLLLKDEKTAYLPPRD